MYAHWKPFAILLASLSVVGGAVAVSKLTTDNLQPATELAAVSAADTQPPKAAPFTKGDQLQLADIERQLGMAARTGGISPSSYRSIDRKLKALEKKKIDTSMARKLLKKLEVGGSKSTRTIQSKNQNPPSVRTDASLYTGGMKTAPVGPVTWEYYPNTEKWRPSRTPPPCGKLEFNSPIDLSKPYAVLYPGQIRGGSIADYKAHGGFLLREQTEVRVPFDGFVFQGARFLQNGVVQYGFDMASECGIMMRFGHLYELSPKFQALAEKMRPAVEMDSRTTDLRPYAVRVSKGELLATKVGVPGHIGMDWGLFDIRQVNEAAKNPEYRKAHKFQGHYDYYALCWLDYLPAEEQRVAKALPGGDGRMGKTSDYCKSGDVIVIPPQSSLTQRGGSEEHSTAIGSLEVVRGEIENAQKTGGRFTRAHYERIERDLTSVEKSGASKGEVERLRKLLVGLTPELADEKRAEEEAKKAGAANAPCTDPPPVLTADITDVSKIAKITAPGSASSEGPKGHSFIWTGDARVPLYAPVAGVYDSGAYYKDDPSGQAQYILFFKVQGSCGWQFKFDHVLEPLESMKTQLPTEPKVADSRGTPATNPIEFKAGDLIGYTSKSNLAGNWDFGLYNMNEQGTLKAHGCTATHCNAVCWPDFYVSGKEEAYRKLLEGPRLVCTF